MKLSKIAFFAFALSLTQVAAGTLVALALGIDTYSSATSAQYAVSIVISICVFAYISSANPIRPYLTAFKVGILAELFGVVATSFLAGEVIWEPITLIFDAPALLVAILVGVTLGTKWK